MHDILWSGCIANHRRVAGTSVVPVGAYENDPAIPAPGYSKQLFQQFIRDSRAHYGKYNVNVPEWILTRP